MNRNVLILVLSIGFLASCSLNPGMANPSRNIFGGDHTYIKDSKEFIEVININRDILRELNKDFLESNSYRINSGDILTITIWGQQEAFPHTVTSLPNNPQNARMVNSNGEIYFPYIGNIYVSGLTTDDLRKVLIEKLSLSFVDPQLDVTITKFNENRNIFVLGEVIQPQTVTLGIEPLSLTSVIGKAKGLNPITSKSSSVYVIRNHLGQEPKVYVINLSNSAQFTLASDFYIQPRDIIFVGASGITRWNRLIGQLFPFSSFINQIDQIDSRD